MAKVIDPVDPIDPKEASPEPAAHEVHTRSAPPPVSKAVKTAQTKETGEVRRAFRLLRTYSRGERRTFWTAFFVLVFEASTSVFEAYPLAYLIDFLRDDRPPLDLPFIGNGDISTIAALTLGVLVLAMVNSAADSWGEILLARGGQTLGYKLRVALYGHLQRLSLAYHDKRRTGDVITRVTGDVKEIEEFVTDSVSDLIGSLFVLVGVLAFIMFNSWEVAAVAALMIPLLALVSNYFAVRIKKAAKTQRAREGDLASTTQEMLSSIRVVQTFGRTRRAEKRFALESGQAMDAAYETSRLEAWFSWIWSTLKALAVGAVVWIGWSLVSQGALKLGILVMLVILIEEMFKPTRKIIKEWNKIGKLFASVERVAEVLDREPTVKDEPGATPAPRLRGEIEFRNVTFGYALDPEDAGNAAAAAPELREALRDVSLSISPGEVVALVGHSGAGKSTIAQLVPRLYDPQEGAILLDGHDLRGFTLKSLRDQISVVLQETVLFTGTVADNIAYGREDATEEEIVAAAKQANAHEFIEQMPDGYETELSERASNLSGGQRQRLAIARALIRGTPILILDEPTTGLDAESTEIVLGALETLMQGKTTLLISHDLGLIRAADRILVLRSGEIEQQGTHASLLQQGGLYAHLYAKQFSDGEPARETENETGTTGTGTTGTAGDALPSPHPPSLQELLAEVQKLSASMKERAAAPTDELLRVEAPADEASRARDRASGDGRVERAALDPLASRELARELPGLDLALDGDAMRNQIQRALIGPGIGRAVIDSCVPGKLSYLQGEGCLIRYSLELTDGDGTARQALVGGRLFEDRDSVERFLHERLEPLAEKVRERDEIAPFEVPVAALDALPMALYVFPIDAELPTLVAATDAEHMLRVFQEMAAQTLGEQTPIEECHIDLTHYPRRAHCLLRYELVGGDSSETSRRVVYGKVAGDGAPRTGAVLSALHEHVSGNGGSGRFSVPRFLGSRSDLNLVLVEAIPGRPQIARLIKARAAGAPAQDVPVTLEGALDTCARIASVLHNSDLILSTERTRQHELRELRADLGAFRRVAPDLAVRLWEAIDNLIGSEDGREEGLRPCHGDFTHSQVVFDDGGKAGLLDFDTMCSADPALDLGRFRAYLRIACRKAERAMTSEPFGSELCDRFLDAYVEAGSIVDQRNLQSRAALYEAVTLIRMAMSGWRQLKAGRIELVLSVLEEQSAWPAASPR